MGNVEVRVTREFGTVGEVIVEYQSITSDDIMSNAALAEVNVEQLILSRFVCVCVQCVYV